MSGPCHLSLAKTYSLMTKADQMNSLQNQTNQTCWFTLPDSFRSRSDALAVLPSHLPQQAQSNRKSGQI